MHTVKPLDMPALDEAIRANVPIVTIEEHSILGGLGGAVAEVLAERDSPRPRLKRIGLPPEFCSSVGSQQFLRETHALSVAAIVESIEGVLDLVKTSVTDDR